MRLHETDFFVVEIDSNICYEKVLKRLKKDQRDAVMLFNLRTGGLAEHLAKLMYIQAMTEVACNSDDILMRLQQDAEQ